MRDWWFKRIGLKHKGIRRKKNSNSPSREIANWMRTRWNEIQTQAIESAYWWIEIVFTWKRQSNKINSIIL